MNLIDQRLARMRTQFARDQEWYQARLRKLRPLRHKRVITACKIVSRNLREYVAAHGGRNDCNGIIAAAQFESIAYFARRALDAVAPTEAEVDHLAWIAAQCDRFDASEPDNWHRLVTQTSRRWAGRLRPWTIYWTTSARTRGRPSATR